MNEYKHNIKEKQNLSVMNFNFKFIGKNKNELNEYDDNRTLAKTGVNQTIWLKYLLEFKVNNDYSAFPSTIKSALIYLEDSTNTLIIFSVVEAATSSISMPPSLEAITATFWLARSVTMET